MAAFFQKLFKSRKPAAPDRKARTPEQPKADPEADKRAELREEQLQKLEANPDQNVAASLAVEGLTADIRIRAVNILQDESVLQRVHKQAKGRDKRVYQVARQKLQDIREEQARQQSIADTITMLTRHAREQAKSDDTKLYGARLEALLKQWTEVEPHATPDQLSAFLESIHHCRERLSGMEAAQAAEAQLQEQKRQREETLDVISRTLEDLRRQPVDSVASLDALQKTQENRWLEATRDTQVEKTHQKAYETSMMALRNYINAVRQLNQLQESLQSVSAVTYQDATPEDRARAEALVKEINWPEGFPAPESLQSVRKLAGKPRTPARNSEDQKQQQATADNLKTILSELEEALEANQLRQSRQLLKTAQQHFRALDQRHGKAFQSRIQLLTGQLRELTDWQGFATEPKQIALCEQMEYLAEQPMEPEAKSERIKELQKEWRDLGGSSNRALWTRFKQASDKAYEPCKAYFKAKSGLKQANLEKRKAICAELEHFLNAADWTAIEWKAVERILQTARQEWKEAWPIEFRENRQVQKQFDSLLRQLEAPIDQERQRNEALKQEIVEQAEALIEHEPLQEAMDKAKALQADWESVGITRHREDRKLWQAFRKACDAIFARRDARRSEQQQATKEADSEATALLQDATAVSYDQDEQSLTQAIASLNSVNTSLLSAPMKEKVQQEKQRLEQAVAEQQLKAGIRKWQSLVLARTEGDIQPDALPDKWTQLSAETSELDDQEIVIRAEILAGIASPDADKEKRMEIQVRRLTEGMGTSDKEEDALQSVEGLVAGWCVKADESGADPMLASRLNTALDNLTAD